MENVYVLVFFFQAEDGIRDLTVTGVQTCALPICFVWNELADWYLESGKARLQARPEQAGGTADAEVARAVLVHAFDQALRRSEERRVGKECRSRWSTVH